MSKAMEREEILLYENGLFKAQFEMFEQWMSQINNYLSGSKSQIIFSILNKYDLNAHASKSKEGVYKIDICGGVVPMTFQLIGENVDFFRTMHPQLEEKEFSISLGCSFIWTMIFAHELGHILRGHLGLISDHSTNLIDNKLPSPVAAPENSKFNQSEMRRLIEHDADVFSSFYLAQQICHIIDNQDARWAADDKVIVEIAVSSIFLFFNYLCELEGKNTKYPPAMIRANTIHNYVVKHLSGKTSLSDSELKSIMHKSTFLAYSFLHDDGYFNQGTSHDELSYLANIEDSILNHYPVFSEFISHYSLI